MNCIPVSRTLVSLMCLAVFGIAVQAQPANPGIAAPPSAQGPPSNVISFSDTLPGQPDGAIPVTFSLYPDQQSTTATWTESQVVQVAANKYTVLLGSATADGIPPDVFSGDQAHWLGVQINGTEKRFLLVSVPFAMKAMEADRLGGLSASQFVTTTQLQAALQTAASASAPTTSTGTKPVSGPTQNASVNLPQPATDFTDNNTSEVLLVTQQGTGFAIHAISAGDAAVFGENNTPTGTGLKGVASSTTGINFGVIGSSASPTGIAGVFDNTGGGQILSLRNNGNEVASVDNAGDFKGNLVTANTFNGNGSGLFGILPSGINATPFNNPFSVVQRDSNGDFAAGTITAATFNGNGNGLFGILPSGINATPFNNPFSVVQRDSNGSFAASAITAATFNGNGNGLFGILPSGINATPFNNPFSVVQRDSNGSFAAGTITAATFNGNGNGLFGILPSGINATPFNNPFSVVQRDGSGNFATGGIQAFGVTDFSQATSTAPVKAVLSVNTPATCTAGTELLIKTDVTPGQQLFICNANGNGYVLVGDGSAAGVISVGPGDQSISVAGTASAPTVSVTDGGITAAKLAPGAVTGSIPDGSLTQAKIAGTAAVLSGGNTFAGTQTMPNATVTNFLSVNSLQANSLLALSTSVTGNTPNNVALSNIQQNGPGEGLAITSQGVGINVGSNTTAILGLGTNGGVSGSAFTTGIGVHGDGKIGVDAVTANGIALQATANGTQGTGIVATFTNSSPGKLISGRLGTNSSFTENFSVDTTGNILSMGGLVTQYPLGGSSIAFSSLVKFVKQSNGLIGVVNTSTSDTSGAIGVALGMPNGQVQVAYTGIVPCEFDGAFTIGDYVGISHLFAGNCTSLGTAFPTDGRQVVGRLVNSGTFAPLIMLYGSEQRGLPGGTLTTINTGAGLTGGPITSSGTISIVNAGVTNSMLQNSSVTLNPGSGLTGGGTAPLGGSITLTNTGALSFNGRSGNVVAAPGDYSFSQLAGTLVPNQLPSTIVFNNQSNTFTADQTITGALTTNTLTTGTLTATSLNVPLLSASGNSTSAQSVIAAFDTAPTGGFGAFSASSQNNAAGFFTSSGPTILAAGTPTHGVLVVGSQGINVTGTASATAFTGDGSALTNVNASSIGGTSLASLATVSALNAETAARQSGDTTLQTNIDSESSSRQSAVTTLQNNINNESSARQSADASLAASISAETAARQTDTSNLQLSINSVSAADAKLATANTFTASNTFTAGTQDFSAAGATLPVRALPSAQIPASCVASKELLIKTDAAAGQQLFICDASGTTWNLVGDGASGGVASFNGRNGTVAPSSGDYSFAQISGSLATSQMPALTGDVTEAAGSGFTLLTTTGVTPGAYSKVSVDLKGRVVSGSQASFSDLTGAATPSQLPVFVVYNNQVNTFSASQAVNGSMSATFFIGNGGGLTNVNAATLNNLPSTSFAQLGATGNAFTGGVSAPSFAGDGSALTNVNAATVNNLQMLKLTASITPANVSNQSCNEQSFTVSGVNAADTILSVQPSGHSLGTNIAIGGWRVPAANTVAVQFCNVSRSSSTPAAGTYTIALMR